MPQQQLRPPFDPCLMPPLTRAVWSAAAAAAGSVTDPNDPGRGGPPPVTVSEGPGLPPGGPLSDVVAGAAAASVFGGALV